MDAELDVDRLTALGELLGSGLPEMVARLLTELTRAVDEIEAAVRDGDLAAAALATHAARNSALMLDAGPTLAALAEVESGARAQDGVRARAGLGRLLAAWPALAGRLEAVAQRRP